MNAHTPQENMERPVRSTTTPNEVEDLGAEPLEGSGFEDETPEPGFEEEQQ
jgi:hypothetical protein